MNKPEVSIIVPVYNGAAFIKRCLESLSAQTYRDIEILVVDDGSTDDSGDICDAAVETDSRIKVLHQSNGGVNSARSKAVENASGEWMIFVDADDCLPNNAVELYSAFFDSGSEILVEGRENTMMSRDEYLVSLLKGEIVPALWAKAFKADFYKTHFPNLSCEIVMGEDFLINLVVGMNVSSARFVKGKLYEVNSGNPASVTKNFKKTWEYEKHYFNVLDELFLNKCKDMERYDQFEFLIRKSQLNGIKYVMLSGNKINYTDDEFLELKHYFTGKISALGMSERLIFLLKNTRLYSFVMKRYMRTLK